MVELSQQLRLLRAGQRSEEHTSELQSRQYLVCRLLLEKKKKIHMIDDLSHVRSMISIFFFNDTATTEIYTLSLHDALPIFPILQHPRPPSGLQRHQCA